MKPDIIKSGAIIIRDKKLLITKPKTKDFWIFVGGKPEGDETVEQALAREVREELGVNIIGKPVLYLKSPIELAAGNSDGKTVQIFAFIIAVDGEPSASAEIEKIHWLSREEFNHESFKLGSILQKHTIPKLITEGKM
jgi:ADP-ribose pyrophosphatase YjhB (NUDIX family)